MSAVAWSGWDGAVSVGPWPRSAGSSRASPRSPGPLPPTCGPTSRRSRTASAGPPPRAPLLSRGERPEALVHLLGQIDVDDGLHRGSRVLVLDEITKVAVFLLADGRLQRDRFLGDLQHLADLLQRDVHPLRDLLRSRLAPRLLDEVARGSNQLVDRLDHVHRDPDRPRLVGDRPRDRLADPPGGVGRELVPPPILELVDRLHQADVPLLDEVEELQPAVGVLLGDGHHQAKVRLDELLLGLPDLALALFDGPQGILQHRCAPPRLLLP